MPSAAPSKPDGGSMRRLSWLPSPTTPWAESSPPPSPTPASGTLMTWAGPSQTAATARFIITSASAGTSKFATRTWSRRWPSTSTTQVEAVRSLPMSTATPKRSATPTRIVTKTTSNRHRLPRGMMRRIHGTSTTTMPRVDLPPSPATPNRPAKAAPTAPFGLASPIRPMDRSTSTTTTTDRNSMHPPTRPRATS